MEEFTGWRALVGSSVSHPSALSFGGVQIKGCDQLWGVQIKGCDQFPSSE